MVWNVAGTVGRSIVILGALALTSPAFAMGKGGGGKPPKDDLMGEPAIVVTAGKSGPRQIQVFDMDLNGPQIVAKTSREEGFHDPVWAPEGIHIALKVSDLVGCRDSVRVTTFDDASGEWSTPEMIVCARSAADLEWDPSSFGAYQRIYLRADPDPNDEFFQTALAVVEFELDEHGNLVGEANLVFPFDFPNMTDDKVWTLAVSPDGGTIAVSRVDLDVPEPVDRTEIALFDVDSATYTTLIDMVVTDQDGFDVEETFWPNHIAWHPSGNYLTVSLSTDSLGSKIYCVYPNPISPNATVATSAITAGFNRQDVSPTWSPNGRQFFFVRDRALARITFVGVPDDCATFVAGVASSEEQGRFEFLLQPGGKITGYSNPSVRLP